MYLTDEQQAILNGSKGETQAKVMKTLVMFLVFYVLILVLLITQNVLIVLLIANYVN